MPTIAQVTEQKRLEAKVRNLKIQLAQVGEALLNPELKDGERSEHHERKKDLENEVERLCLRMGNLPLEEFVPIRLPPHADLNFRLEQLREELNRERRAIAFADETLTRQFAFHNSAVEKSWSKIRQIIREGRRLSPNFSTETERDDWTFSATEPERRDTESDMSEYMFGHRMSHFAKQRKICELKLKEPGIDSLSERELKTKIDEYNDMMGLLNSFLTPPPSALETTFNLNSSLNVVSEMEMSETSAQGNAPLVETFETHKSAQDVPETSVHCAQSNEGASTSANNATKN